MTRRFGFGLGWGGDEGSRRENEMAGGLVYFLVTRAAVPGSVCVAAVFLSDSFGWRAALGIFVGFFAALYKIRWFAALLGGRGAPAKGQAAWEERLASWAARLFAPLFSLAVLVVTVLTDIRLFAGAAMGMLLIPAVICVNALTERLGLTRNFWGMAEEKEGMAWKG
ncbi:MAG: hypothetical protein LBK98_04920 [Peptococcaceae bacterium]|jgi:hypothetical protein|nr:hypothetical protein [Peptococcaceae bacterium]